MSQAKTGSFTDADAAAGVAKLLDSVAGKGDAPLASPCAAPRHEALPGGASNRTYHRVWLPDGQTRVVMVLAEEPIRSEEATSGPVATELPFVEMQRFLARNGVRVPRIDVYDTDRGQLWLEDLGDLTLLATMTDGGDYRAAYRPALELLVSFQRGTKARPTGGPIAYRRRFEPALLRWELDHYVEWRVEAQLERRVSPSERALLDAAFDRLVKAVTGQPQILCHRDFQSTNLMAVGSELVLIDFQDALIGSYSYDLVALLRDSYVALSPTSVDALVGDYLALRPDLHEDRFRRDFHVQTIQRKLKDAGRFVYIDRVKGNPHYLQYVDRTLRFVRHALEATPDREQTGLREILATLDPEAFA